MTIIVDTNVLVSAALFDQSVPFRAFALAVRSGVVLKSVETLDELLAVLKRERFDRYVPFDDRVKFVSDFDRIAKLVAPVPPLFACRDPKDDKFLSLAVAGQADVIVTGDDDLITLNPFRGVTILTPQQFLDRFGQ